MSRIFVGGERAIFFYYYYCWIKSPLWKDHSHNFVYLYYRILSVLLFYFFTPRWSVFIDFSLHSLYFDQASCISRNTKNKRSIFKCVYAMPVRTKLDKLKNVQTEKSIVFTAQCGISQFYKRVRPFEHIRTSLLYTFVVSTEEYLFSGSRSYTIRNQILFTVFTYVCMCSLCMLTLGIFASARSFTKFYWKNIPQKLYTLWRIANANVVLAALVEYI